MEEKILLLTSVTVVVPRLYQQMIWRIVLVYFELSLGKKKAEDEIVKIVYCERAQVVWVKAVKSAL